MDTAKDQLINDILQVAQNIIDSSSDPYESEGVPNDMRLIPEELYHRLDEALRAYDNHEMEAEMEVDDDAPLEVDPTAKPAHFTAITTEAHWGAISTRLADKGDSFLGDGITLNELDVQYVGYQSLQVSGTAMSVKLQAHTVWHTKVISDFVRAMQGGALVKYEALVGSDVPFEVTHLKVQ